MQQDARTIYGKFMGGKIIINLIVLAFFYVVFPDGGQFDFVATQFFSEPFIPTALGADV